MNTELFIWGLFAYFLAAGIINILAGAMQLPKSDHFDGGNVFWGLVFVLFCVVVLL